MQVSFTPDEKMRYPWAGEGGRGYAWILTRDPGHLFFNRAWRNVKTLKGSALSKGPGVPGVRGFQRLGASVLEPEQSQAKQEGWLPYH